MKIRNIVLIVCLNHCHKEALIEKKIRNLRAEGVLITNVYRDRIVCDDKEYIFKLEDSITRRDALHGMVIHSVEGFVPAHLEDYINSRVREVQH